MASLRVLAFDHEGRLVQFDTWLDDLQVYLLSDSKDSVSLFDLASGAATTPPATADSSTRSQWLTRDAAARLAIRNHLPLAECAHFGQHRTAQALYDAVVARYSSPATAALGRLLVPYLFLELSAFTTVEDLASHLRASDARYRAAVPAEFLDRNPPPMYITLYFIVTRLPDSLRSVRDHFLSLDPTSLTVDLLEQHLFAAETSAVAVDVSVPEDVGAASASAKHHCSKGKGGRGGGGGSGVGGGGSGSGGGGNSRGGGGGGTVGGVGALVAVVEAVVGVAAVEAVGLVAVGLALGVSVLGVASTCGWLHPQHRCFSRLDDAWRAEFGDDVELPCWADLLKSRIAIFDLEFDAILSAMYALSVSAEGDCYRCVPPDPGIAAATLGASESSTLPGTAPTEALHTFTLDSGASRCFFCDSTTLTPLPAPVPVRVADPSGGPVVARSSTVLLCPAVPSGSLSSIHLPSFSTNLVSTAALQNAMVTTTTPGGQRVSICTCTRTGRHLAMFTRQPGSSLYTLTTEPSQVATSAQVSASGHPSLPRLCGMHSRLLVFGLPMSLPPLPPSPAPPCLPCVKGRQRAALHSSSFPPTTSPLQTLHMDVWGPARISGQSRKRYFLLVVDDYTRYTTVFPLRSKGQVVHVLIPCIRTVRLQLHERFGQDLPVLRLHSDRGGEFSSNLLRDFCRGEGILQSFTLPDSPKQNGIAERRIGLVMEVARTSMIHAAAPHFLWPFVVRYAAHQLNLWPRVSLPETSRTLRWTGEVGDASVFRVWGSRAFVRDTSADKLSPCAIPCVFLGFVPDAPGWQFYHPTSRRVFPSQDVMFDKSVHFYCLFPYRSAPPPLPPLFLAPGPPPVDPLSPQGPSPSGVSQVDPLPGPAPVQVAVGSGAARGAASGGAASRGAEPGGAESEGAETGGAEPGGVETGGAEPGGVATGGGEPGGAEPEGVEPGGAASEGAESRGAEPQGAASSGGSAGASPRLSPQQLREWFVRRTRLRSGASGAGGAGAAGAGGLGVVAGAGVTGDLTESCTPGAGGAGAGGAGVGGLGAGGARAGGPGVGGVDAGGARAIDPGGTVQLRLYFVPLLHQVLGTPPSAALTPPLLCPPPDQSLPPIQPASPLPNPSPYTEQSGGLTERREPAPRLVSPFHTARRVPRSRPPLVPCTHAITLRPSCVPLHSAAASALVAELLDFATACRLDYASSLVAESATASPPSVGGEFSLGTDVLEDRQEDFESLAAAVPRFASMLLAPEGEPDAPNIPTPHSYEEAITVFLQGSLHEEIWLRRPSGFTGSFPAGTQWSLRRPVYGLRQAPREWHDTLRTTLAALGFAPTTADPSLFLRTDTSLPPFYVLVYVNDLIFATADTKALTLVKSELQKRHTCIDLGELRSYLGLQITRDRARRTITLTQSHMVHQVLQRFGFHFSSPQPTPLSTCHSLSAPPSDESVELSGPYLELVGCLITSSMGLVLGGRGPVVLTGHTDASWVDDSATQRSSQGYTFSLGSGSVSWRSTRSSSVLSSSCEAEIYAGAMAAQELHWLTFMLTDLGEQPRSPPVLYVDNKAMIALCQEHRLEHKTKHIALRYFLARELQQRGQLRLAYVATQANTSDVFTKALPPGDYQCFVTVLGLVPTLPHLLTA
ncbi:unnamed protein product [Closterium sp. NIES-54]